MKLKHDIAFSELKDKGWAITPEAYEGLTRIVKEFELSEDDAKLFHHAQDQKVVAFQDGIDYEGNNSITKVGSVGILTIDGPLIPRARMFSQVSGIADYNTLSQGLATLVADDDIETIVPYMDTPGGDVVGLDGFASELANCGKKTIAYVYGAAQSAGYWIASACDEVVMAPTGKVGSLGVVAICPKASEDDDTIEIVSSVSPLKRVGAETKEGEQQIQTMVDDLADVFVTKVAEGRATTKENVVTNFGKGGSFIAAKAVENGMADSIMSFGPFLAGLNKPKTDEGNSSLGIFNMKGDTHMKEDNEEVVLTEAEIQANAESSILARMKDIESISGEFAKAPADIQKVVASTIDANKFEAGASKESVKGLVLSAIAGTYADRQDAVEQDAHDLADELPTDQSVNTEVPQDVAKNESDKRTSGLLAAGKDLMGDK